ncbi:MAG: hypothetical protein CFH01_00092 [Alphaproteobacteria bacterium MarineAlpha2_Bin1]|nr:MAG: hypothetical protein CFH01_00092 [Alphaproteobacteria bacterium MarineAlpha2_Bin1]|tara:strand:- start:114 stop:560 length:447 start_codon:yes stop_codon:yes gene_type:complete
MNDTFLQRISINISDIDQSESFYTNVLGFSKVYHKTIPLKRISGYPINKKNKNGSIELIILSQGMSNPMLGLMKTTPLNEKKSAALVFYTNKIQQIYKNFTLFGGSITMGIRKGESFDIKENKMRPSLVIMGTDPNNHFVEVVQFAGN